MLLALAQGVSPQHSPCPRPCCRLTSTRVRTVLALLFILFPLSAPSKAAETVTLRPYLREFTLTGFTRAKEQRTISSELNGRCLEVLLDQGDSLPASGRLVLLDTTFLRLELEAKRLARKKVERRLATEQRSLRRYTTLHDQKSIPQASLDEVRLQAELHRLSLKELDNQEERIREQLRRSTITAPPGWELIERMVEPGEFVQTGQAVARVGDYRELTVPFAVTFPELQALQAEPQLSLRLPDLKLTLPAAIHRVSPEFEAGTRKIPVQLLIPGRHGSTRIRGGIRSLLRLTSRETSQAFLVPKTALLSRYDAHWLVRTDKERVQVILLGSSAEGELAIISAKGLSSGDRFLQQSPPSPAP
ncbi:efflux RND transporter periplasmic adaptor subunit [Desulfogranum mediterraneum]|uniref:efflux RND transporter periplasmic adaptor subunit n=1 Tax=Desulfogranum mediterraneum TaxID=160661 RepID=UPI00068676DF|nr:efflux RND transporter periplasmic adaptor subunit [Desulfogranum mediterraneum]